MILYKYVYAGLGSITLTRAHTHLNLWILLGPVSKPMKAGFYHAHCGYFFVGTHRTWFQLPSLINIIA